MTTFAGTMTAGPTVNSSRPRDAWLVPVLATLVGSADLDALEIGEDASIWRTVVGAGLVTDDALLAAAAAQLRLPLADLSRVSPRATQLVAERWARRYNVLPLAATETWVEVATSDPFDLDCERALAFATGRAVRFALASPARIAALLDETYRGDRTADRGEAVEPAIDIQHLGIDAEVAPASPPSDDGASVTRLVDQLLADGVRAGASDIHVEPEEEGIVVRHRVDGVLRDVTVLPRALAPALVSRVKILSGLDIADRLRPQDGRARVAVNGTPVDLRISTLPASRGEKVVVRILDARTTILSLDGMGFSAGEQAQVERLLEAREGIILVTGPTGSGKTTTLYAALRQVQDRGVNVVTVEDPVEYRIPGIVQVQVRERAGLTFGAALRSIMRQDPDVILVGEIRDRETAEIAIQASLTGHLVLSTLHTNDAASAVTRLVDIGVAPHKIATAVKGVLAQRLLRRLCDACRVVRPARGDEARRAVADGQLVGHARGCVACGGTGYRGRLAILEVLVSTAEIERLIAAGETTERIAEAARAAGMGSLWESGLAHVLAGETTLEELLRVAELPAAVTNTFIAPVREPAPVAHRYIGGVTEIAAGTVDAYVIRPLRSGWRVLALQRAPDTRCPGAWETVHGRLESGERPEDGVVREIREETGLAAERLYVITVQPYYLKATATVQLAVVFAAFVSEPAEVTLGPEHQRFEWLEVDAARTRFAWPRERDALDEIMSLLRAGDAGAVEDVLRVR
jgi:type II secretory ATPase GspE/PulE/Tfp pilus assembly ATPase PilB-like protein/8-oxo-dGTP pyrophosphatase MutT (NUDIX family)